VNPNLILLNSQSTADIFCNPNVLTNIRNAGKSTKVDCNTGTSIITQKGTLTNYGEVCYNAKGIANILSLAKVKQKYPVRYDSDNGNQFIVVQPKKQVVFQQSGSALYYHDTTNRVMVMVNTAEGNREGCTDRAFSAAKQARRALGMVGYPSEKDFKHMVSSNMILNCPVTRKDINAANNIFGPNVASMKGKTVRSTQDPVLTEYVEIPKDMVALNKDVTLTADVMFVDGLGFLVTASRSIKSTTKDYVPKRSKADLINSLKKVFEIYSKRGFKIKTALMDREFECLRYDIRGVMLNTTAASEHVTEIERQIRVIKERARAIRSTLPFKKMPNRMIVELINFVVLWLNAPPPSSWVSKTYIPRTSMTGTTFDYNKHCKLPYGAYVETHKMNTPTNTTKERTRAAICLGPTANFLGSYKFLCRRTGCRITRKQTIQRTADASNRHRGFRSAR
jgi:hypothetical protein